jgi:hypothetical protein
VIDGFGATGAGASPEVGEEGVAAEAAEAPTTNSARFTGLPSAVRNQKVPKNLNLIFINK